MTATSRLSQSTLVFAGVILALFGGSLVVQDQRVLILCLTGLGILFLIMVLDRIASYFLLVLGLVLLGYGLFDRGFAYLGLPPLFVGEVAFVLALVAFLVGARERWRFDAVQILLILFMVSGLLRMLPFVATYGFYSLRDSVIWAYAVVALAVAVTIRTNHIDRFVKYYRTWSLPFLIVAPVLVILDRSQNTLPTWPISGGPIIDYKIGDLSVHLAGLAAFILMGLFSEGTQKHRLAEWPIWMIWLVGGALSLTGRSALLTIVVSIVAAVALATQLTSSRISSQRELVEHDVVVKRRNHLLPMVLIFTSAIALVLVLEPEFGEGRRTISVDQVITNVQSLYSADDDIDRELQGTTDWRLSWWNQIVDYTVHGEYFWQGKGFGVNLAADDDVPRQPDLRSPHSIHFNILARMGVPGLILWIATQVAFAIGMLRAFFRARQRRDLYWQRINAWIFVYWLAFIINASFDVYLEGPQGGIWFWAVFGFGLAALRIQHDEARTSADSQPSTPLVKPHARSSHS